MTRSLLTPLIVAGLLAAALPAAAQPPKNWDGLMQADAKRFDAVYLAPDADFRTYSKVMLDPTEVAFEKNWQKDYNATASLSNRIKDSDAQKMMDAVRDGFEDAIHKGFAKAGYEVVAKPGPEVLRVRTGVVNLHITAPDRMTAGRNDTYSYDAGAATVFIELRDSMTGALLARAVDGRTAGNQTPIPRTRASNRADFMRLFETWTKISIDGLADLKARTPVAPTAANN